ncbi:hypothetical protein FSP39_004411, partial [Pinctada imbricata]
LIFHISQGYAPPFRCKTLGENLSVYDIGIHGNLSDFHVDYAKCDLTIRPSNDTPHEYRNMEPRKFDCLDGYHFDHDAGETWNLICGNSGLGEMSTTMVMVGMCLGAAIFTSLADRYGRKTVAVYTHLALLGFQLALAFMPNLPSFAAVRLVLGALQQGLGLSTYVVIIEMFPMEWRGFLAFIESVMWACCVSTLVMFAYFLRNYSWRYIQIALALVSFHALFGYWLLDESLRWLIANKRTDDATRIIKKAARWNGKDPQEALQLLNNKNDEVTSLSQISPTETKDEVISSAMNQYRDVSKDPVGGNDVEYSAKSSKRYNFLDILKNKILLRNSIILWYTWIVNSGTYYGLFLTSGSLSAGSRYLNFFINTLVEIPGAILFYLVIDRNVGSGLASAAGRLGGVMSPYSSILMQYAVWAPGVLFGSCCFIAMFLMFFLPETGGYVLPQTIEEMEVWTKEQSYLRPYKKKKSYEKETENEKNENQEAELAILS